MAKAKKNPSKETSKTSSKVSSKTSTSVSPGSSNKDSKRVPLIAKKSKNISATATDISNAGNEQNSTKSQKPTSSGRMPIQAKAPRYTPEEIATRAYFIQIESGGSPEENWKQAEAEFQAGIWKQSSQR
jgi:hypothetical protein